VAQQHRSMMASPSTSTSTERAPLGAPAQDDTALVVADNASTVKVLLEDQASAERVENIYSYLPTTQAASAAGAGVVMVLYWGHVPHAGLFAWLGLLLVLGLVRTILYRSFWRERPTGRARLLKYYEGWRCSTLVAGVLWGAAAWFFYQYGGVTEKVGLILTIYSFCMAAMQILSPQHHTFYEFCVLALVPLVVKVAWPGTFEDLFLAGVLVFIFGITVSLSRLYRKNFEGLLQIKVQADQLLVQLRAEKAAADKARQEAEVANRAKTQFFAAASHDLRQPLHAMGLFAEALRQRSHDEEVTRLVTSINGSVDALEGLFSELLDITKIDTGGVDVAPEHFNIGGLFRKLRLHFEPTAFEKGLSLRFRGESHNVYADPVLVERILRNLVSNAIRYTNDGSVLVSCRRRAGRMILQVWDTGVGIRDREQARIFEEFYQVPQTESLSPLQRKGLGLGLAIVKRLAADRRAADTALRIGARHHVFADAAAGQGTALPTALRSGRQGTPGPHAGPEVHRGRRRRAGSARRPRSTAQGMGRHRDHLRDGGVEPCVGEGCRCRHEGPRFVIGRLPTGARQHRPGCDPGPPQPLRAAGACDHGHRQHDEWPGGRRASA